MQVLIKNIVIQNQNLKFGTIFNTGNLRLDNININKTIFKYSKFNISNSNSNNQNSENKKINIKEIQEKLYKEGAVKIYDSKYTFNSEKLLLHSSVIFLIISSTTIFFTEVSLVLKIINFVFLFTPSLLVQIERFLNNTRFVKMIQLLPENKIRVHKVFGKKEEINIEDLIKAENDKRIEEQVKYLNNETFIIFTNKKNTALYHVPRDGIFLNEDLFHNILEGTKLV